MADAALMLLASLDAAQQAAAAWAFPSDDERRRWFYTPTDHGGVSLADLTPSQQRLAMRLLASGLSVAGYVTVSTIMALENILDAEEGWTSLFDRQRGRDPNCYYVRIFGQPSSGTWSWRFGGHHVSIHHTVIDGEAVACTPCFMGADPAHAPLLGPHPLRPLAGAEDLGRELVRSLDAAQWAQALISPVAPTDVVGGNRPQVADGDLPISLADIWRGHPGFTEHLGIAQQELERKLGLQAAHLEALRLTVRDAPPKGVSAATLVPGQQELLRALLGVYVGRVPDDLADAEAEKYAGARLNDFAFAWAGGVEPGQPHYYRVQGPRVLVEYDNTQRDVNHVHAVWRDPERDFGEDVLAQHRAEHH
ncbi:MAG TPA: DUF3500 domain-containing protein [Acidimicrobiales bacterium]|jgi:hypothetical protein